MSLKKVILVFVTIVLISLLVINTHYTLDNKVKIQSAVTIGELPPPPGTPSFEQPAQQTAAPTTYGQDVIEQKLAELTVLKQRVASIETAQSGMNQELSSAKQRITQLEGQVNAMQQAGVPKAKTSAFGVIIDIILLLAIAGMIGYYIYTKKEEEKEKITAIKEYMRPYLQQGYKEEQMIPSLRQAGYKQKEIEKALAEIRGL